jgi:hypothetical protein
VPGATEDEALADCPSDLVPTRDAPVAPERALAGPLDLELVAQVGGVPGAVLLAEPLGVLAVGGRLATLDLADPARARGTSAPLAERVTSIANAGEYLAVALGREGLAIVDADTLTAAATLGLSGYAEAVAVAGDMAYVADGPGGLRIVDISDPAQPSEVGRALELHRIMDVAVAADRAYLAAADEGLIVLDVADPGAPRELGRVYTGGYAFGVDITADGTVVLADGWDGIRMVDVANPRDAVELARAETRGWALDVAVDGDRAAIAGGNEWLLFGGISNGRFDLVSRVELPAGRVSTVDMVRDLVALGDESAGVSYFDTGPVPPARIAAFGPLTRASGLALAGDRAYVAALNQGLRIIDVSDPAAPVDQQSILTADSVNGVMAARGRIFFTSVPGLGSPYTGSLYTLNSLHRVVSSRVPHGLWMEADGSVLFVAAETDVDVVDTRSGVPCLLGTLATYDFTTGEGYGANGISVVGDTAYVADYFADIHVLDVSDPRAPREIESAPRMDGVGVGKVLAVGDLLYAIAADAGGPLMAIFDVTERHQPRIVGRVRLPAETARADEFGPALAYGAGYLWVADGTAGLVVIDVSDQARPVIAGQLALPGEAVGVAVADGHAYVITDGGGLFVVDFAAQPPQAATAATARFNLLGVAACTVTSTADSGAGSLRDCLARAGEGTTITFDPRVFPSARPATISATETYEVPSGTTIDASGAGVILEGRREVGGGISLESDSIVRGLIVTGFGEAGVVVHGTDNLIADCVLSDNGYAGAIVDGADNRLVGNLVGLDPTGRGLMGRQTIGLFVGSNHIIGGANPEDRNVITGDLKAIFLKQSSGVVIEGNFVGTDVTGEHALGVGKDGRTITIEVGSHGNRVIGNVVAGTVSIIDPGSSYNSIIGNRIGIGSDGKPFASGGGVNADEPYNRIGGTRPGEGNLVAGIDISAVNTFVLGNRLGVDETGARLGDGSIHTTRSRTVIGGRAPGAANWVATFGITIFGSDSLVIGNQLLEVESPDLAGIRVASGVGNQVVANRLVTRQGVGLLVEAEAMHALIVGNTFLENRLHAQDAGQATAWDDGSAGNYWSGFDAPDANGDGILDQPREIPPRGFDRRPLPEAPP